MFDDRKISENPSGSAQSMNHSAAKNPANPADAAASAAEAGSVAAPGSLEAFEARLGALRPRNVSSDPKLRSLLAESVAHPVERCVASFRLAKGKGNCSSPDGHYFVCIYCGAKASRGVGRRRTRAASLAAVVGAAAALLVMFAVAKSPHGDGGLSSGVTGQTGGVLCGEGEELCARWRLQLSPNPNQDDFATWSPAAGPLEKTPADSRELLGQFLAEQGF